MRTLENDLSLRIIPQLLTQKKIFSDTFIDGFKEIF